MGYIDQGFFDFFADLAKNNKREWFHKNKKRYENLVKEPFKLMVDELIFRVQDFFPDIEITSQKAIFRINRDIRFSKDKTPYKTHVSANIQNGGRNSPDSIGHYLHMGYERVYAGGGMYHPSKEGLHKLRSTIANSPSEFTKLITDKTFRATFGEIKGARLKRVPKEFKETFEVLPIVGNKQFYFMKEFEPEDALANDFTNTIIEHYKIGAKVNQFFQDALQT